MKVEKASTDYLKAGYVQLKKIVELQIPDKDSIKFVTFEGKDGKPDTIKISCDVTYKNQAEGDPFNWTMNNKCRNAIIDAFGDDTDNWINKIIPITIGGEGEMLHILVDTLRIGN